VNAVIEAITAIASGAVGGAAKLVENALVRSLPVVIGFLASLLGISGLAKKVQGIVKKIRSRIDQAIDKVLKKAKSLFKGKKGKGNKDKKNKEDQSDERTKEEKEADLGQAMKDAKTYLDKFSDKEVNKKTVKSKFNKIKETYGLKSLEPVEKGVHWGIRGEVNPKSEDDSQAELSEQEKLKVIAKALNTNKAQIVEQLAQNPDSRNKTRNETLSQVRTMDKNSPPEFEGYILDSILQENRQAFRTIKSILSEESPDVLMAMERGGAFLGEVLTYNNEELGSKLHKIEKGTDPNPDPKKKLRFNPDAFKSAIKRQIGSGKKSFAIVDAYMGGRFAGELRDDPNSQQPFHIFDAEGNIIKTIQPEKEETSRDTLIKLLNG